LRSKILPLERRKASYARSPTAAYRRMAPAVWAILPF